MEDGYPIRPTDVQHRIEQFDGLRALAFSAVFVHHAFGLPLLWAGVDLFFVLSGFIITSILRRERKAIGKAKRFYIRRVCRIVPPYLLLLVCVGLVFGIPRSTWIWYATFFGINVAQGIGIIKDGPLSPLWSLAIEEQFYLVWPFLVFRLSRRKLLLTTVGLILSSAFLRGLCTTFINTLGPIYCLTPFRLDTLAAGSLAALLWEAQPPLRHWRRWSILLLCAGAGGVCALYLMPASRTDQARIFVNAFRYTFVGAFATGVVMYSVASPPDSWPYLLLSWKPFRGLGVVSYTAYLFHQPMLALWVHDTAVERAILAFVATIGFAALSWFIYERPIIGWGHRIAPQAISGTISFAAIRSARRP